MRYDPAHMTLAQFNALPEDAASRALLACCSSPAWARRLTAARPFGSPDDLYAEADRAVAELAEPDLDHALDGHPRIGERRDGDTTSAREQSAVGAADAAVRDAIAEGNRRYERRFGHVYLVAASGRGAEDLLADLRARLDNDPTTERAVLRAELAKINRIRLRQLVDNPC